MGSARQGGLCTVGLVACVGLIAQPAAAQSVTLFPAQVSGPNIDCLFSPQCTPTPHDEVTEIPLPGISGKALLHSRTILGAPGSNASGRTAYQYRIDLSDTTTLVDSACITNLSVKFGPIAKLPYAAGTTLRDVYEIVQGVPSNQIGFATAVQAGNVVTFTFIRQICAGEAGNPGKTSFSFGLSSLDAPVRGVHVQIDTPVLDNMQVKSFGPIR